MRAVILYGILVLLFAIPQANAQAPWQYLDNTNFEKYQSANESLLDKPVGDNRVVFMGNSITEAWPIISPQFFENSNFIGRGISRQTTPQMLLRFRKDVIDLNPEVVVILAGINDIAQNSGFTPIEFIAENIISMSELAKCHNIEVVLCSVLPAIDFPWSPGLEPVNKVIELNAFLQEYAEDNELEYVDYHSAMKDDENGLKVPEYTSADDLVHPNEAGYILMEQLVQPAIDLALEKNSFSVAPFFSDHMVLQQNNEATIWGKGVSGTAISVSTGWGESGTTLTDDNGSWSLSLKTPKAGGPYQLSINSTDTEIKIEMLWSAKYG